MAVFSVISLVPNPELDKRIVAAYTNAYLALSQTAWLVADKQATTKDVCDKINVKVGGISGVVVIKIESYFGIAPPNIWEWLKLRIAEV
jgi:hypothetical protein